MADFAVSSKLAIARSCEHFWMRGLRQNVVRWLHFKRILIERRWDLRRGVLGAREFRLLVGRFYLGPPFEEFKKIADFGVFAKLAIARSWEHFWMRELRQNVVRLLHFKRILIRRRWNLRRGVCVEVNFIYNGVLRRGEFASRCFPPRFWMRCLRQNVVRWLHFKCILIRRRWDLVPPLKNLKMADFGFFAKLAIARSCEHFWMRGLRQNVVRWLHFKRILIRRRWDLRRGVLGARECSLHFGRFSLGPPFWRILKNGRFWCTLLYI